MTWQHSEAANTRSAKDAISFLKKSNLSVEGCLKQVIKMQDCPFPLKEKIQNLFKNKMRKSYNTKSKMI